MAKQLQLTIPTPCHENWDNMTPVDKGRFCGSCQKQVVDFSNMSDRQVAEFFKKPILSLSKGGSVCGRFMTDQLDRQIEIPKKRIPWVKYFFQIALPAFLVSMKTSAQKTQETVKVATKDSPKKNGVLEDERIMLGRVSKPQNLKPITGDTIISPVKEPLITIRGQIAAKIVPDSAIQPVKEPLCSREKMGTIAAPVRINKNEIEGIVVDESSQPVPFASIETGKPGEGLMADANGYFKIKKNWLGKGLVFSSTGFEKKKLIAGEEEYFTGKLYVQLKANVVLPEVVVTSLGQVTQGKVMGYSIVKGETITIIDKKEVMANKEIAKPLFKESGLLIYPNPVRSGGSLNLSFKKVGEGYYQLQIISQSGQIVQQKEIWIDAEARVLNIDIPAVAAGSYFLVLINKKTGKKFTEKIIVR